MRFASPIASWRPSSLKTAKAMTPSKATTASPASAKEPTTSALERLSCGALVDRRGPFTGEVSLSRPMLPRCRHATGRIFGRPRRLPRQRGLGGGEHAVDAARPALLQAAERLADLGHQECRDVPVEVGRALAVTLDQPLEPLVDALQVGLEAARVVDGVAGEVQRRAAHPRVVEIEHGDLTVVLCEELPGRVVAVDRRDRV